MERIMIFKPDIRLDRITEITPDMLRRRGISALILDVDNTLSTHHGQQLAEGLSDWLSVMKKNGIGLTVLSNSTDKRLKPFAEKIGLDYISMGLKPLPFGYFRALKRLNAKKCEAAIVGDQIFTDVLGGHLAGVKTVLLTPIKPEASLRFRAKRRAERWLIKKMKLEKTKE